MEKIPQFKVIPRRQFLGKLDNFKDKNERVFNQRALQKYLQGNDHFYFGYDAAGNPMRHEIANVKNESGMRGNGIACQSKYPLYTIPFYRRCGKNMTKA